MVKHLRDDGDENKRVRTVLAVTSLYLSYAITSAHIPRTPALILEMILYILKELMNFKNKISPPINTLRCFLYLALNHFMLTRSSAECYQLFTDAVGGSFVDWF